MQKYDFFIKNVTLLQYLTYRPDILSPHIVNTEIDTPPSFPLPLP